MFSRVLFVQALQTSNKTNAREYRPKIQIFSNYRGEMVSIFEIITLCRRQYTAEGSRVPPQNTKFWQLLACLAQSP